MPRTRQMTDFQLSLLLLAIFLGGLLGGLQLAPVPTVLKPAETGTVHILVPAVDGQGRGVPTNLDVTIKQGTGKVLANIDQLLFITDTQQSIQIARDVASNLSRRDTRSVDITYSITAPPNVSIVGGPSAGAALTISTLAALKGSTLKEGVAITGTINPDGSIGEVGGVAEKAGAARARGITLFLVPVGEGTESKVKPVERCHREPDYLYCETVYEKSITSIGTALGLDVKEVASIFEAAPYFGL